MPTQIINAGASIKVVTDNVPRFILKNQIKEVGVLRDTIIKIDIGQGALYNIFIDQLDVTAPTSTSVDELRDKIMDMLQTTVSAGLATEQKQIEGNTEIVNMKNSISVLNDKLFYECRLVDESNSNVVYRGFANPGVLTSQPVWAIQKITNSGGILSYQWADGNKNFDNIWNNRKTLPYS
jgi:hypothetical protein